MKKQLKLAAKRLAQIDVELDATKRDAAHPGFMLNQWGQYWRSELVHEWLDLNVQFLRLEDADERLAASFSHAMFLLKLNRLKEAEGLLDGFLNDRPAPALRGKVIAKARRGLLEEAREMNRQLRQMPHGASFGIPDEELLKEVDVGKQFMRVSE